MQMMGKKIMMPMTRRGRSKFGHSFASEDMKQPRGSADLEALAYVSAGHSQDYGARVVPLAMISDQILSSCGSVEDGIKGGKSFSAVSPPPCATDEKAEGEGGRRLKVSCVSELPEELKELVPSALSRMISDAAAAAAAAAVESSDDGRGNGSSKGARKRGGHGHHQLGGKDDLMQDLQLGIRYSVGRMMMTRSSTGNLCRRRGLFHPESAITVSFPSYGSHTTPPHHSPDFKWKDYCPLAFRHLRHLFQIDAAEYMLSICGNNGLRKLSSPGKSGSTFYYSHDDRYLIKTLRKSELRVLLRMLPRYFAHVQQHESTLLTRFLGLHMIRTLGGQKVRFVVMQNAISAGSPIHRKFDLKGSSHGRSALKVGMRESTVLKDLDLDYVFRLDGRSKDSLLRQIAEDCEFLESEKIMDYSLLLGLHFNENSTKSGVKDLWVPCLEERSKTRAMGSNISARACSVRCPNDGRDVTLYLGIIDILQEYDMGKKLEHAYKSLQHDALSISAVDPGLYSRRFQQFMHNIFIP